MKFFIGAAALLLSPLALRAQSEMDVAEGKAVFRSNCAFCHGLTGGGGRGPTLITGRFLHGSTDDDIKNIIRNGVPGTTMPSFENMPKDEIDKLVQYIRSLTGANVKNTPLAGNADKGRQVYERSGCGGCHRIGAAGSIFGPELTRIGAGRSSDYIRQSILDPSADIPEQFEGVTVVARDGKKITGVRINEDNFSVQLRDRSGRFHMFQKDQVAQVIHETKSLMPPYHSFSKDDLQNLLAYLDSLRGELNAGAGVKKAEGIK